MKAVLSRILFAATFFSALRASGSADSNGIYDYVVVGSGPGGGPLASNLALAGHSVLLLEAGEDKGEGLNQLVPSYYGRVGGDPEQRWDFFVRYHSDNKINDQYTRMTWRTRDGRYYVGLNPPAGATKLGIYYPRAGTLGGCSTHNALCSVLPLDEDWEYIQRLTGDQSWSPKNMRKYFERLENNHYLPNGTKGHGFAGYLDISMKSPESISSRPDTLAVMKSVVKLFGQDSSSTIDFLKRDINSADPDRDTQIGLFGFPTHMSLAGRRVSARDRIVTVASNRKYKLKVQLRSLATKVIFEKEKRGNRHRAVGVEYLEGLSLYSADPRHERSNLGKAGKAYARKEVIISGGAFNTPQLLQLSGVGPESELKKHKIEVIANLPGVGSVRDNYESGVAASGSKNFTNPGPPCTYGAEPDPCLELWRQGKGPYTYGPSNLIMYKTKHAAYGVNDLLLFANQAALRGFWLRSNTTYNATEPDPPSTFGFTIVKIHSRSRGTIRLRSADPRDTPDINFRFFEDENGDDDLTAIAEGIDFGRKAMDTTREFGPWRELDPCRGDRGCDVKDYILKQSYSHHAAGSCPISADRDKMGVLDSRFRVRGVDGLRVVDASAFPRSAPGAFPVLPTFILSEKASDVILEDARARG